MILTQNDFDEYKKDTPIYHKETSTDEYGAERYTYADEPEATIHTMWHPLTDEASIAQYGEVVNRMLQAVVYEDVEIHEHDKAIIDNDEYIITAVIPYQTHKLVRAQKL